MVQLTTEQLNVYMESAERIGIAGAVMIGMLLTLRNPEAVNGFLDELQMVNWDKYDEILQSISIVD